MKTYKVTLSHTQLTLLVAALGSFQVVRREGSDELERIMLSICEDLCLRFYKKKLDQRLKQSFTLKEHEAKALMWAINTHEVLLGVYEVNELRILSNQIRTLA